MADLLVDVDSFSLGHGVSDLEDPVVVLRLDRAFVEATGKGAIR